VPDYVSNLPTVEQQELLIGLLSQKSERVFPLSLAQQRLWFLDRLYPGNPGYNVPFGLRLQGNLSPDALNSSIQELIQRHEILRTTFEIEAGHPVQVVAAESPIDVPLLDLTAMSASERQLEANRIGIGEARLPFNLATGPLLRLKLIRLAAEEHLLVCVMHHIVCDGWSLEIFIRDLAALYHQHSGGPGASLADLQIQYGDYAGWQREWIAGELLDEQAQYWKHKLSGAPPFLQLPADRVRPSEQTYNGASQLIFIPHDLVHNLAEVSRARRSTLFMVMLAAFKTLLHSYTGTDDILVGVPVAGRSRVELEDLVGFFVNILVLRTDLSGDPHFSDLLFQVRGVALEAFAHADLPFEKLVEDLNPPRTLNYNPVIQVLFSAVKAKQSPKFGDISTTPYIFNSTTSLFDLSVEFIEDTEDRCWMRVEYATSLFDFPRMTKLLNDYLTLLGAVATQPDLRISRLQSLLKMEAAVTTRNGHCLSYQEALNLDSKDTSEPRDALEQILLRIWERVLGISGIGIRDNFFDLGGHSLLAAQLVSEVEKAVGRPIPLSTLFRGSTIESFAEVLHSGTEWSPDPLVMEINAGTHGSPLFAVVQSGVEALGYAVMARHMGTEHPFYKLQARDSFCPIVPFTVKDFRTIAREYIAAMRTIQPKGPYFLIGMCNGAHIAEQMVLELEAQGQEVGFLGIIDTFVLQHPVIRWIWRLESLHLGRQNISKLPFWAQISHYKQAVKRWLQRMVLREIKFRSPWSEAPQPGEEFHPKQFRAQVILFKRPRQPYFMVRDHEMGWGSRSLSGVRVCTVNIVDHMEMLREPAVQMMAEQLRDVLAHMEKEAFLDTNMNGTGINKNVAAVCSA
jgi:thioesterase domain-containing protein/acyl carrier protein